MIFLAIIFALSTMSLILFFLFLNSSVDIDQKKDELENKEEAYDLIDDGKILVEFATKKRVLFSFVMKKKFVVIAFIASAIIMIASFVGMAYIDNKKNENNNEKEEISVVEEPTPSIAPVEFDDIEEKKIIFNNVDYTNNQIDVLLCLEDLWPDELPSFYGDHNDDIIYFDFLNRSWSGAYTFDNDTLVGFTMATNYSDTLKYEVCEHFKNAVVNKISENYIEKGSMVLFELYDSYIFYNEQSDKIVLIWFSKQYTREHTSEWNDFVSDLF